jgi:hypothetical protein
MYLCFVYNDIFKLWDTTCLASYFHLCSAEFMGQYRPSVPQNYVLNPHIEAFNVSKTPWPDLSAVKWSLFMCITQKTRGKKVFGLCPRKHFPVPESLALASIEPIVKLSKENLIGRRSSQSCEAPETNLCMNMKHFNTVRSFFLSFHYCSSFPAAIPICLESG